MKLCDDYIIILVLQILYSHHTKFTKSYCVCVFLGICVLHIIAHYVVTLGCFECFVSRYVVARVLLCSCEGALSVLYLLMWLPGCCYAVGKVKVF